MSVTVSRASSRWFAAALGIGIALRLLDYLRAVSFNIDEARIALNLGMRSPLHLLPPLDHNQSAPLLYLWAEKLAASAFGLGELGLRSVPLVAGIAALLLLLPVARRLLDPDGALLAVALAAVAPGLVQYSAILKQYEVEALVSVVLLYLYLRWREAPESGGTRLALVVGGALAVWASAPSVFILAGVGLALLAAPGVAAPRWRLPATLAAVWALSFAPAYLLVYRSAALDPYMTRYWEPGFLHWGHAANLRNAAISVRSLVWGAQLETLPFIPRLPPVWIAFHLLAAALAGAAVFGLRSLAKHAGRDGALLVGTPLALVVVAATLSRYPFVRRTLLFAMPLIVMALATGLAELARRLPARLRRPAWVLIGLLVVAPNLAVASLQSLNTNQAYPLRTMVEDLRRRRGAGEPVYVGAGAIPTWAWYSTDWAAPDSGRVRLLNRLAAPGGAAFENAPSRGRGVRPDEGSELHYMTPAGEELLGSPSGIESWGIIGPLGDVRPDSGWAAREARRVREAACPGAWVLLSQLRDVEKDLLLQELERVGGVRTFFEDPNGAVLARFEFAAGRNEARPAGCAVRDDRR
jgi:hypothetical protein